MTDQVIRTCKACGVDVSVPPDQSDDAECPRCAGPLSWPSNPQGDATEKTMLEVRPERSDADTLRDFLPPPSVDSASDSDERQAATGVAGSDRGPVPPGLIADTATFPAGPAAERIPLHVGARKQLGPYLLRGVLGKGGMGIVYEAYQPDLERTVALKVMSGGDTSEEEFLRFKREARAAAKLQHKNIVPIHEIGEHEGQHYFTMDLVRGRTLQELARSGQLQPEEAARLVAKVARAIQYAHERDIIHRDLKPSNVIVDTAGEPHVMDFGLAKDLTDVSGLTLTGVAMGSPPYMPPEQARGEFSRVDAVSDVYGLGATLYECLAGRPPFKGKSLYDVIAKVLVEDPPSVREQHPEVPYDLETVCIKAMEKEKWRRYPTAEDLALDLDRHLQGLSIRAMRQGLTTRMGRVLARHRLQIFSVLIPVAVVAALAAYAFGGGVAEPQRKVVHEVAPTQGGPVTRAGEELEARSEAAIYELLKDAAGLPTWAALEEQLAPVAAKHPDLRAAHRRATRDRVAAPEARVSAGQLSKLLLALVKEEGIGNEELGSRVEAWLKETPALARLVGKAAFAGRGNQRQDLDAWRRALTGPLTPLDRPILIGAAHHKLFGKSFERARDALCAAGSPQRALKTLRPPPQVVARAVVRARERATPWSFPLVRQPNERLDAERPAVHGLLRPGVIHTMAPAALRVPAGDRVVVAWLRFVYLLRDRDGAIVRRRRLPGLVEALQHDVRGGYRVRVWKRGETRWVRVRQEGDALEVLGSDGRAVPPVELLPEGVDAVPDQLRRVACALFPEFDDLIEVRHFHSPGVYPAVGRVLRVEPPPGTRLDLGFRQERDCTPAYPPPPQQLFTGKLAEPRSAELRQRTRLSIRSDGPAAKAGLRGEDELVKLSLVGAIRTPRVVLWVARGGTMRSIVYKPLRTISGDGWRDLAGRIEAYLAKHSDPNPWVLAFKSVTLRWMGSREQREAARPASDRAARLAVQSGHLTPHERVAMGCFLDRHGIDDAAEAAFERALRDLGRGHGFVPEWAGYGPFDCGQLLARRVEQSRLLEGRLARSLLLARWRDAFAPVLRESEFARRTYASNQVDLRGVEQPGRAPARAPPEVQLEQPVPKGIAGLDALNLQRIDHAVQLQGWFLFSLGGFVLIVLVRYRRHAIRGLRLIGVEGAKDRLLLWIRRPWVRLRFSTPMFFTLQDKLGMVVLFLLFFGVFAMQDAGLEALVAPKRAREPLLAGTLGEPTTRAWLEDRFKGGAPGAAYALAWAREACRLPPLPEVTRALQESKEGRARLLLAEIHLRQGEVDPGRRYLELAKQDPSLRQRALLIDAGVENAVGPAAHLQAELAKGSRRLALARWIGTEAGPLAPAPTVRDRDRLLLGTSHWAVRLPGLLLRNLVQPFPERMDASISAFQERYNWSLALARFHNRWFFVLPAVLVLLVASLFMPTVHRFEPLEEDLAPPRSVRILGLLFPGLPQFMRGRPVRGILLLFPFCYIAQTLHHAATGTVFLGLFHSFSNNLSLNDTAALTAETVSALEAVRAQHYVELATVLFLIYALHWVDLALAQRKVFTRGEDGPGDGSRLIIPVDSEAAVPARASTAREPGEPPGPFDVTEKEIAPPSTLVTPLGEPDPPPDAPPAPPPSESPTVKQ